MDAIQLNLNNRQSNNKETSKKLTQISSALISSLLMFTCGSIISWTSPCLPKLVKTNVLTENEADFVLILAPLGIIIGSPFGSFVVDRWGRKMTLIFSTIPLAICLSMFATCKYVYAICIARILGSFAEGVIYLVSPIFSGEVAEPDIRGRLSTAGVVVLILGNLAVNAAGLIMNVQQLSLLFLSVPVISFVLLFTIHDTPYFYLMKKDDQKALESLRFYRRIQNVHTELQSIKAGVERQMEEKASFKDLFTVPVNRRTLLIAGGLRCFQTLCGIIVISMNAERIMIDAGSNLSGAISAIIFMAVEAGFMAVYGFLSLDRFNRKHLLCIASTLVGITLSIEASYLVIRDYSTYPVDSISWLPLTLLLLYLVFFNTGVGTIAHVTLSELFSASIKAHALNVCTVLWAILTSLTAQMYTYTSRNMGKFAPFTFFALASFLVVPFSLFLMPDTRGKTLEEVQQTIMQMK